MKRTLLAVAVATLTLAGAVGTSASAQGWDQPRPDERHDRGPNEHRPDPRRPNEHRPNEHRPDSHRPDANPGHRPDVRPEHGWRAGERLPPQWREQRYVIARPATHHLHRPPPGHRWVRVGPDAVLIISGTGVIVEFVPNLFR
ncbi:RcnB family protein [Azospirillum sp. TSO35-2]|uniref:RcnB family protein n=1 Tax=Azospirillum sp. TSO35-2 TaxID=716796 RepID=UPI001304EF73|nr:RcnB family protein [Azospirillum sp. TSO35-2]